MAVVEVPRTWKRECTCFAITIQYNKEDVVNLKALKEILTKEAI